MRLLRSTLVYVLLGAWLLAVVLPLLWVFGNSLRSSREFVESPFGLPWLITGIPADQRLSMEEIAAAKATCGKETMDSIPCDLLRFLEQAQSRLDTDGDGKLARGEVERLAASNKSFAGDIGRLFQHYDLAEGRESAWAGALRNYRKAWIDSGFSRYVLNSVIVTVFSLFGILAVGSMAAYVLARFTFLGGRGLYFYFISGLMIPAQLVLVPLFFQFTLLSDIGSAILAPFGLELRLHDSLTGLTLLYIALSLPFTILVLTGFFRTLPGEMREAAIIDGCGEFRAFWHVMLPLARPGLVTAAILNFLGIWNEYLFALVFVSSEAKKTLPLGLASVSMQAQYKTDFGLMFAGLVIIIIPTLLVYVVLQRRLTEGITVGALKG